MLIGDFHCDSITKIIENDTDLFSNKNHLDIERMLQAGEYIQFFAAFVDPVYGNSYAYKRAEQIIEKYKEQISRYKENIAHCCNFSEIIDAHKNNKAAGILSIENGAALEGKLSNLYSLYDMGVRSICLTWNFRNEISEGIDDAAGTISGKGLTPFGVEVVKEMNRLGMLIDVSHLSESGFWHVIELSSNPVIASHSNAKRLCNNRRNLTDEQLIALKNKGGVVGVNFYPYFLTNTIKAGLADIIRHIEYMSGLIGTDHIGLGSDFDGIEVAPEDVTCVNDMHKIFVELARLNYSQEDIEKIAGKNLLRVVREVVG